MPQKTALLIVDVQKDYFPGGQLPLVHPEVTAKNIRHLLDYFRQTDKMVVHVQHITTRPNVSYLLAGTPGIEIYDDVKPDADEPIITKDTPNAFHNTNLLKLLHEAEITDIVITGMMTQTCVDSTTRAAKDFGFTCIVPSDATTTRNFTIEDEDLPADTVRRAFLAGLSIYYATTPNTKQTIEQLSKG